MSFILNISRYGNHLKRLGLVLPPTLVVKASNKTISFMVGIEEGVFFVAGLHMVMKIPVMI